MLAQIARRRVQPARNAVVAGGCAAVGGELRGTYNIVRLNSAIGYITPRDVLAGSQQEINAKRDRNPEEAQNSVRFVGSRGAKKRPFFGGSGTGKHDGERRYRLSKPEREWNIAISAPNVMDTLYTQRLILRPLTESDATDLFGARGDAEVMEFWDWPPDATRSETIGIVDLLLSDVRSGAALHWTVRLLHDESFAGVCDLSEIRDGESADIGFAMLRKFWGVGFGNEVVGCLLEFARSLGLKVVTARIHAGNTRSQRLLERMGFRVVEVVENYEIRPDVFRDCLRFEVTL